ncbi:hypothetical protein KEM56_005652, partial [Ascosphaera pollenicola]
MAARSHITCHVLNTHAGTPAAHLPCALTIHSITSGPPKLHAAKETVLSDSSLPLTFTSTTDADGRVSSWGPASPSASASPCAHTTFAQFSEQIDAHFTTPEAKEGLRIVASVRIMGVEEFYRARGVESFWPE